MCIDWEDRRPNALRQNRKFFVLRYTGFLTLSWDLWVLNNLSRRNSRKTSLRLVAYLGKYICTYMYFSNLLKTNYGKPVVIELAFCGLPPCNLHLTWKYPNQLQKALHALKFNSIAVCSLAGDANSAYWSLTGLIIRFVLRYTGFFLSLSWNGRVL